MGNSKVSDKLEILRAEVRKISDECDADLSKVSDLPGLREIEIRALGRKSKLSELMGQMRDLPESDRPKAGKLFNDVKTHLTAAIKKAEERLTKVHVKEKLKKDAIDLSLPAKRAPQGRRHILHQVIEEITATFLGLGYTVAEGPEIELDYYNFEALNIPKDHPARSLQDTLYIQAKSDDVLLRTHTSPVQIRVMKEKDPPLFILAPGRVYRRDVVDPTHSPVFHQIEGFVVDRGITFADLKGTLEFFVHQTFGPDRIVRLRPSYFPFTEPSAEVDVSCGICAGEGCRACGGSGWLEILGAGMIDPNVLKEVNIDPEEFSGFAFGMGVERIAMLKFGINDIRLFFENDIRFLNQF